MARPIVKLEISEEQRRELLRMVRASTTVPREVPRVRLMLLRSEGKSQQESGLEVGLGVAAVRLWEQRFRTRGVAGLKDTVGHNRKVPVSPETVQRVVTDALHPPPQGTHWTLNSMARHAGISQTQVQRIWSVNGIKPHARTFELAHDKNFAARFWDVIGLYLNPPYRALVLCTDEKLQRLALQRTEPALPLGIGSIPTGSGDFVSPNTARLFAALYYLDGKVISRLAERSEHAGWLRFLEWVHRKTPRALQVHLIADNTGIQEHPEVEQWLAEHPRLHVHVVPASDSWLDLVERVFSNLGQSAIGKGSLGGVPDLTSAIEIHLSRRNLEPKPYRWHATRAEILSKLERARELESLRCCD